ncbi:MAG TPA: PEP/pyruvate-binding domain-containing protein [Oligoflexus sp.]|uniref:PEP/pyruvate-binding domain-containing protein n=1 Tax=Oligoflexus sp. TaxID=1971216 RepID=UPI002D7F436F|nr:PEP/pyruvate-binding domain-containing protein [Oligoflexus sp.]HET9239426.1 PEP/pyruvate-binding domain-containing protein [Oligoflexus sp.]
MILRILMLLALCGHVLSCSPAQPPDSVLKQFEGMVTVEPEPLTTETFWTYFVGTWQDPLYRGYIKFSIALDASGKFSKLIWHPERFRYHAEHLTTLPEYAGLSAAQVDAISQHAQGRRLLLGTLLIPKSVDEYNNPPIADVQLMSQDPLDPESVTAVFSILSTKMPSVPETLFYLPGPEQMDFVLKDAARFEALGIKLARRHTAEARICYNAGWGVGHVRVVKKGELEGLLAEGAIGPSDILVMDDVPRELPIVAGIVVSRTSSPSSHPALLAGMLGIPFVYEEKATAQESWLKLARSGKAVFVQATGDAVGTCQILVRSASALTPAEADSLAALKKPQPLVLHDYDRSLTEPVSLDELGRADADKVGAKAANVAELRRIIPDHTVTEGLALPLGIFAETLRLGQTAEGLSLRSAVDQELSLLLGPGLHPQANAQGLARIRALIEGAKIPAPLQRRILDAIAQVFPKGTRIKLRSSSNIEDHPEFNGAGLYESKGACAGDDARIEQAGLCQDKKDPLMKSVLKVWASLYSLKAWSARRYYGVKEEFAGMGILVQRAYKGELANGVAISSYPAYNSSGDGPQTMEVQSTAFPGEDLEVANPPAGKIPETTRITATELELQIPSTEVARGRMLMTEALYRQLYEQMNLVHEHYREALKPQDPALFKLDMEWKLISEKGTQKIIIKQVRPVPMPTMSTQGLDRGLFLIGERQARLCPSPSEHRRALTRLQLGRPLQISVALQELPADERNSMINPVESLRWAGKDISLSRLARFEHTPWEELWGTRHEYRTYTVSVPVETAEGSYELQWTGRQERPRSQPRLLVNQVQSLWTAEFRMRQGPNPDDFEEFQMVLGDHACESDAYQGFQPGTFQASSPYAAERSAPTSYFETYASETLSLNIQGRSSFQGFDKTRFVHIDSSVIRGLLPRELILTAPLKAVYAPGHHNFTFEYAWDLMAADQLTAEDAADLQRRGIQRLVLRSISPFASIWDEARIEGGEDPSDEPAYELIAVDAKGQERKLDRLKQTGKSDFMNGGPGFGIGILP